MKKSLFIIIIIFLIGGGYAAWNNSSSRQDKPLQIGEVSVKDIYASPVELAGKEDVVVARSDHYEIIYYGKDESFVIAIKNKPVQNARDAAEQALLDALGITPQEACKLSVQLSVLGSVDLELAGQNYGLSFCPDGKPLNAS